jgi:hypothetical protein
LSHPRLCSAAGDFFQFEAQWFRRWLFPALIFHDHPTAPAVAELITRAVGSKEKLLDRRPVPDLPAIHKFPAEPAEIALATIIEAWGSAVVITRERRSTGIALIVLEAEIACELAMLSAVQARYDYFEAKLASRPGMKADRSHVAEQLRARLRKHRQGHVLRLADLHDRMLCSTLYRGFKFNSETRH